MYEALVKTIDPTLRFVRGFANEMFVLEVEREGSKFILKTSHAYLLHVEKERKALQIARDVPGITHLVDQYHNVGGFDIVLLKEYFPGADLRKLNVRIKDVNIQRKLEETVRALHSLGICYLDLDPRNVLLSPDRTEARLFDFGTAIFAKDCARSDFESTKADDLRKLETLIFA